MSSTRKKPNSKSGSGRKDRKRAQHDAEFDDHEDDSNWMPSVKKKKASGNAPPRSQAFRAMFAWDTAEPQVPAPAPAPVIPPIFAPPPPAPVELPPIEVERPRLVVKLNRPAVSASTPTPSEMSATTLQDPATEDQGNEAESEAGTEDDEDEDEEDLERSEERHIIDEEEDRGYARAHSRRSSARLSLGSVDHSDEERAQSVLLELAGLPLYPRAEYDPEDEDEDPDVMDEDDEQDFDLDKLLELATTGSPDLNNPSTNWFIERDPDMSDLEESSDASDALDEEDSDSSVDSDEEADGLLLCPDSDGDTTDTLDDADETAMLRYGIDADADKGGADLNVTISISALAENPAGVIAKTARSLGVDQATAMRILRDVGASFDAPSPKGTASRSTSGSTGPRTPLESPEEPKAGPSKMGPEMGTFAVPNARPVGTSRAVVLDGSHKTAPSPFSAPRTRRRTGSDLKTPSRARDGSIYSSVSDSQTIGRSVMSPATEADEDEAPSELELHDVLNASILSAASPKLLPSSPGLLSALHSTRRRGAASHAFSPAHHHSSLPRAHSSGGWKSVLLPRSGRSLLHSPSLVPVASPKVKKSASKGKGKAKASGSSAKKSLAPSSAAKRRSRSASAQKSRRRMSSPPASHFGLEPPSAGCNGLPSLKSPAVTAIHRGGVEIPALNLDGLA